MRRVAALERQATQRHPIWRPSPPASSPTARTTTHCKWPRSPRPQRRAEITGTEKTGRCASRNIRSPQVKLGAGRGSDDEVVGLSAPGWDRAGAAAGLDAPAGSCEGFSSQLHLWVPDTRPRSLTPRDAGRCCPCVPNLVPVPGITGSAQCAARPRQGSRDHRVAPPTRRATPTAPPAASPQGTSSKPSPWPSPRSRLRPRTVQETMTRGNTSLRLQRRTNWHY